MDFDNNEPFWVIYRIGCLWAYSAQGSQCSSAVCYGREMPNPAHILVNRLHYSTTYRWRLCFGNLSFSVILKCHFGYCSPLLINSKEIKNANQDEGNHL